MTIQSTTPFDDDLEKMIEAAKERAAIQEERKAIHQKLIDGLRAPDKKDPGAELIYLIALMADCGLGDVEAGIGEEGGALKTLGDGTQVSNDLQNILNGNGPKDGADVEEISGDLDKILDALGAGDPSKKNQSLIDALGSTQVDTLKSQYLGLRQSMYVTGSSSSYQLEKYTPDGKFTDDYTNKVKFDASNPYDADKNTTGKLIGFSDMHAKMSLPGDPANATEAAKGITDATQLISSTTDSTNAALNVRLNSQTSIDTNLQSSIAADFKAILDTSKAAVQNQLTR